MTKLKRFKILEPANPNKSTGIVNGKASGILNWNDIAYPHFYEDYLLLQGNNWIASSINMADDKKKFLLLSKKEQDAYLKIIALLATFDAPQTRVMFKIFDYITDPSVFSLAAYICKDEAEHNRSYSYVLSSVTTTEIQKATFEFARTNEVIQKRNEKVMACYDRFLENTTLENFLEAMVYSNALEGIFFYSGFAFFFNLARQGKMVGTQTMISYINRDELAHGKVSADILRAVLYENPDYNTEEFAAKAYSILSESAELEIEWSKYVLEDIDGIDLEEMSDYVKYRANKIARNIGLSDIYEDCVKNPMPWIEAYADNFGGGSVKTDFFEQKNREYTEVTETNGFDEL